MAEFLFSSIASEVMGSTAYDVVRNWWQRRHRKDIDEVYVEAFGRAAIALEPMLQHYAESGAEISVQTDLLREVLRANTARLIPSGGDLRGFLRSLTAKLQDTQVLIIPGHQLSSQDYQALLLKVLELAWQNIFAELSYDEILFRDAVKEAAQSIQTTEEEILSAIRRAESGMQRILLQERQDLILRLGRVDHDHQQILELLSGLTQTEEAQLTFNALLTNCLAQVQDSIEQLSGQYISQRYVNRSICESEFRIKFLQSDKQCFLILGKAGEGKTNLSCYLAERHTPCLLFLSGRKFDSERSIQNAIQLFIDPVSMKRSFKDFLEQLNSVLEEEQKYLLILIDGINESPDPIGLNQALASFVVAIQQSRIKLCLSCRDTEWSYFHDNKVLRANLFNPLPSTLSLRSLETASLNLFSEDELDTAWRLYRDYYKLEGLFTTELRNLCRDPFMLYLLGEAYSNRELGADEAKHSLPQSSTRLQMFDKYWERKAPRHHKAIQHSIYALAKERRTRLDLIEVSSTDALALIQSQIGVSIAYSVFSQLLSEKILVQTGEGRVKFTYDLVFEYTSARQFVYQEHALETRPDQEVIKTFEHFLSVRRDLRVVGYGSVINIATFALAILILNEERAELLDAVYNSPLKEEFFLPLLSLIEQLPSINNPAILKVLNNIAEAEDSGDLQYVLARVLRNHTKENERPLALALLRVLADSSEEIIRLEVVDSLEEFLPSGDIDTLSILEKLANDADVEDIRPAALRLLWREMKLLPKEEFRSIFSRLPIESTSYLSKKDKKLASLQKARHTVADLVEFTRDADLDIRREARSLLWKRIESLPELDALETLGRILENSYSDLHEMSRRLSKQKLRVLLSRMLYVELIQVTEKVGPALQRILAESLADLQTSTPSIELLLLKVRSYSLEADLNSIKNAYSFVENAFASLKDQNNQSALARLWQIATILVQLEADSKTIVAGLLTDLPRKPSYAVAQIEGTNDQETLKLIDLVYRVSILENRSANQTDLENLRRLFEGMYDSFEVVTIKLAQHLARMRLLDPAKDPSFVPLEFLTRKSKTVYTPLANRLGLTRLQTELEDLSFQYSEGEKYQELMLLLEQQHPQREAYLDQISKEVISFLEQEDLDVTILKRPRSIYSIYQELVQRKIPLRRVYSVNSLVLVVQEIGHCYFVLGRIHSRWNPIPGEFDDYISRPRQDGYQSLHTSVFASQEQAINFVIRTHEMHRRAEFPDLSNESEQSLAPNVYVSAPGEKGGILALTIGATPIDFAYRIHTVIGHRCRGAKVNGRIVPLEYMLQLGDQVEILTVKKGGPSLDWLNPTLGLVHTSRAKTAIRQYFRKQEKEAARMEGRARLEKELSRLGLSKMNLDEIAKLFNFANVDELTEAIGLSDISLQQIGSKLLEAQQAKTAPPQLSFSELRPRAKPKTEIGLEVGGIGNLLTRLAQCCKPVPGDEIVGYISHGRGIVIHRRDCKNVIDHESSERRWIMLSWKEMKQEQVYSVTIEIRAFDRSGLLRDLSDVVAEEGVNMTSVNSRSRRDSTALITATLEISNANQLTRILNKIGRLPNVLDTRRISG